jgi:restriction system protein
MSIPAYDVFIPTLLRCSPHPEGLRSRDAHEEVGSAVGLSEEDRATLLPSGGQAIYQNRIGWAHDRLKRAGYSQSLRRGYWQLTDSGRAFAAAHPDGMDQKTVDALALIPKTSKVSDGLDASRKLEPTAAPVAEPQGPEERIDDAIEELNESLARDLLAQIGEASPALFERLVLDLLLAMGYGASRADLQPASRRPSRVRPMFSARPQAHPKRCVAFRRW